MGEEDRGEGEGGGSHALTGLKSIVKSKPGGEGGEGDGGSPGVGGDGVGGVGEGEGVGVLTSQTAETFGVPGGFSGGGFWVHPRSHLHIKLPSECSHTPCSQFIS